MPPLPVRRGLPELRPEPEVRQPERLPDKHGALTLRSAYCQLTRVGTLTPPSGRDPR
jgi:hypothetical protein